MTAQRTDDFKGHYIPENLRAETKEGTDIIEIFATATKATSDRMYVVLRYESCLLFRRKAKCKAKINVQKRFGCTSQKLQHCSLDTILSVKLLKLVTENELV